MSGPVPASSRTGADPVTAPRIRLATVADVPALCRLGAETFRATYRPISTPSEVDDYADTHFTPERVAAWFAPDAARTLLAIDGGAAVGYAHVRAAPVPACVADRAALELSRLYLLPQAQGTGLGTALLARALALAGELGAHGVWLGAYDRNAKALAFYERHGFARVGTHDFEFGGRIHADPVFTRALRESDRAPTIIRAFPDPQEPAR